MQRNNETAELSEMLETGYAAPPLDDAFSSNLVRRMQAEVVPQAHQPRGRQARWAVMLCGVGVAASILAVIYILNPLGTKPARDEVAMQSLPGSSYELATYPMTGLDTNAAQCLATATNGFYNTGRLLSDWNMGGIWAFGHPNWAGFSTILPPNSPSCYERNNNNPSNSVGVFSVSSMHTGGVVIAIADGSVRFITQSIDCGNYGVAPNRNFGVWGALGTIAGGEVNLLNE